MSPAELRLLLLGPIPYLKVPGDPPLTSPFMAAETRRHAGVETCLVLAVPSCIACR